VRSIIWRRDESSRYSGEEGTMRRLACCLLAVAGCNNGPSTPTDLYHQLVTALCQWEARCGAIGKSEEARCEMDGDTYVDKYLQATSGYNYQSAVAAKRLAIDSGAANTCLNGLRDSSCNSFLGGAGVSDACRNVYHGLVAIGGACQNNVECSGGYCLTTMGQPSCMGTCMAYATEGSPCTGAECDPAKDFCGAGGICVARGATGAACQNFNTAECKEGLACVNGTCAMPGTGGQPCMSLIGACASGYYCPGNAGMPSTCAPSVAAGQACAEYNACQDGLRCVGLNPTMMGAMGTCTAVLDVGATCDPTMSACPSDAPCEPGTLRCSAPSQGVEGAPCTGKGTCKPSSFLAPPLYCDPSSMKCAEKLLPGQPCTPPTATQDDACVTSCDPATANCAQPTPGC
jgi:hypothetical protein